MKIFAFGDSITEGFSDRKHAGWCTRLTELAHQQNTVDEFISVYNLGISGDNSRDLIERVAFETKARFFEGEEMVFIFAIGTNDSQFDVVTHENRVPVEEYKQNLKACILEAKKYTDKVLFLNLTPVDEDLINPIPWKQSHGYSQEHVDKFNATLREVVKEEGVDLVDVASSFDSDFKSYLEDGLHPNTAGHELILNKVKEKLIKLKIL